jgi:formate/nitrite transporter FocA (FNT family)
MWVLLWQGALGVAPAIFGFFLPVLAGNVAGGTLIFALLAWVQVKKEVGD